MPNFSFPLFKKIELADLPDIFDNKIIVLTIIEVLNSISKSIPLIVFEGIFSEKSKSSAKEAMKKAKKTRQYALND